MQLVLIKTVYVPAHLDLFHFLAYQALKSWMLPTLAALPSTIVQVPTTFARPTPLARVWVEAPLVFVQRVTLSTTPPFFALISTNVQPIHRNVLPIHFAAILQAAMFVTATPAIRIRIRSSRSLPTVLILMSARYHQRCVAMHQLARTLLVLINVDVLPPVI